MIYLDNNATTPVDERVVEAMMPYFTNQFGNAASNHQFGVQANDAVRKARRQIGQLINCDRNEIIFTSGATEAVNLAIKGAASAYADKGKHVISVKTEHYAVLDSCKYLEEIGYDVTYLSVDNDGLIDLEELKAAFREDTVLVTVMYVNNETGVIQSIAEIAEITHENDAIFMTDATQAVGKIPLDVRKMNIDLLAFSGHKLYAPKGIGALYVQSRGRHSVKLNAIIHGGGHERGMRSGTLNVPFIVGLGEACELARKEMKSNQKHIKALRDHFEQEILKLEGTSINGSQNNRLYNISNVQFKGVDADALMLGMPDVMVSTGSACTSAHVEPSHVLIAMEFSEQAAFSSLRFSFGKGNILIEIEKVLENLNTAVKQLRAFQIH
ncbi:MAG: cysteine desulfurase family protein [Bacteroidota bacterium]